MFDIGSPDETGFTILKKESENAMRKTKYLFGSTPEKAMEKFQKIEAKNQHVYFGTIVHVPTRREDEWMCIYAELE